MRPNWYYVTDVHTLKCYKYGFSSEKEHSAFIYHWKMNMRINSCHTIVELESVEKSYLLNEGEQLLMFERQMEILRAWRVDEQLGLVPDFTDTWTPEQHNAFIGNWHTQW